MLQSQAATSAVSREAMFAHAIGPHALGDRSAIEEKPDLHTPAAAEFLGVTPSTLKTWRCRNRGPAYFRGLGREVLYRRSDLVSYRESLRVTPGHDHR